MRKLGCPEHAVKVDLYINATTSITTSAGQSDTVRIQRGTMQGDTLSPFVFLPFHGAAPALARGGQPRLPLREHASHGATRAQCPGLC